MPIPGVGTNVKASGVEFCMGDGVGWEVGAGGWEGGGDDRFDCGQTEGSDTWLGPTAWACGGATVDGGVDAAIRRRMRSRSTGS